MAKKATATKRRTPKAKPDAAIKGQQANPQVTVEPSAETDLARAARAHDELDGDTRESRESVQMHARPSRDQELRAAEEFYEGEDFNMEFLESANLVAPKPLPGMTQRWVATRVMGQVVPQNETRQWRQGWRPRKPESVTDRVVPRGIDHEGNDYIGFAGLVLMHRPVAVARKARELNRQRIRRQHESIEGDLRKDEVPGQPITIEHRSQVITRPVAEEEEF